MNHSKVAYRLNNTRKIIPSHFVLILFLIVASVTTACNLPITITRFVEKGMAFQEPPYTVVPEPSQAPIIVDPNLTFELLIAEVENTLVEEHRNCNSEISALYYPCLQVAMNNGADANEALLECSEHLREVEINDRGGLITISDHQYYYRDGDNFFRITYFSEGGEVEGVVSIEFNEGEPGSCSKQINYTFNGTYDPTRCILNGSGTYISDYSGSHCIGAIRSEYSTPWQASVEDGFLRGLVENTAISFSYEIR